MPIITKRYLNAVQETGQTYIIRDDELTGFGVQVTPSGTISFCVTYSVGTKSKRKVIGRFGLMTVDKARKTAMALLATANQGQDPLAATDKEFATLIALFEAWMARHVTVHLAPGSATAYRENFDTHLRKRFGHLPPSKIEHASVAAAHAELSRTPTAANHMLRTLRAMLSWAEGQKLVHFKAGNPARGHRLYGEKPADRILTVPEIRTLIAGLPNAPMSRALQRMLMLQLLLGQRADEISGMRKSHVDTVAATWTNAKNKSDRPHVVPLPPWAREIIEEAIEDTKGPWLFPSPVSPDMSNDAVNIDAHAMATALRRAQRPVDEKGKPMPDTPNRKWVFDFRDREDKPNPISPHDLRRTCASYLELLGFGDFIRGAILNHSQRRNVTAKHYSAADLLKLKHTALLQWEAALRRIMAGEDPFATSLEDDRAEEARVLGLMPTASAAQTA